MGHHSSHLPPEFVFILWLLILVVIFFILRSKKVNWWSALALSILIALIVLITAYPYNIPKMIGSRIVNSADQLLGLIIVVSILIIIVYIIDRISKNSLYSVKRSC